MRILSPTQVRALDQRTIDTLGLPAALLMETAGRALAQVVRDRVGPPRGRLVTVLSGSGNNGGDGFVVARVLADQGFRVAVFGAGDLARMTPETRLHYDAMQAAGTACHWFHAALVPAELSDLKSVLADSCAIVDALVGIGPESPLREPLHSLVTALHAKPRGLIVAADMPSGLSASDGRVLGVAVRADVVVAMAAAKAGLFLGEGPAHWRELVVADIGVPRAWLEATTPCGWRLDDAHASRLLPPRPADGHKGRFGHLLLVAGSAGKAGAALLAGEAALRSGCGLCTLATSADLHARIEGQVRDLMMEPLPAASLPERLAELLHRKTALAIGPGLGTGDAQAQLLAQFLQVANVPMVWDADALTLLARAPDLAKLGAGRWVLTPHPGEMAVLLRSTVAAGETDRLATARAAAERFGAVVVYKGSRTIVAAPDGHWAIQTEPNPALGKGGTGDVLTGAIGSLLAQGLPPFEAACLGVAVHAAAGHTLQHTFGDRAGLASDLVAALPAAWRQLGEMQIALWSLTS